MEFSTMGRLDVQGPINGSTSSSAIHQENMEIGRACVGSVTGNGEGLRSVVVGQPATFTLTTYGPDGKRQRRGGEEEFVVIIQQDGGEIEDGTSGTAGGFLSSSVRDCHDGSYEVSRSSLT